MVTCPLVSLKPALLLVSKVTIFCSLIVVNCQFFNGYHLFPVFFRFISLCLKVYDMKVWQFFDQSDGIFLSGVFSSEHVALIWKEKFISRYPELKKLFKDVYLVPTLVVDSLGVDSFFQ